LAMLHGVLRMVDRMVGDVMVPAVQVDMLNIADSCGHLMEMVIDTVYDRFPVHQGERYNIISILLAKDLLKLQCSPQLTVRALLRPVFVLKRKHLNDLLSEFHSQYHHQAIVMDEFGRVAGFVTLSDMMGEILGEIGDEFDSADRKGEIFNLSDHSFRVSVDTTLDWLFEVTKVPLIHSNMACDFNTLGALITHQIGHSHRRDEHQTMTGFDFRMLHPESGVAKWFKVSPVADASS
jgi:magnesium and cobalt transporter